MSSFDNFFDKLTDFSSFPRDMDKEAIKEALKDERFWIDGIRLQEEGIGIELISRDWGECEFFIPISALVDGLEEFLAFSDPECGEASKAKTLAALSDAIERVEKMDFATYEWPANSTARKSSPPNT